MKRVNGIGEPKKKKTGRSGEQSESSSSPSKSWLKKKKLKGTGIASEKAPHNGKKKETAKKRRAAYIKVV